MKGLKAVQSFPSSKSRQGVRLQTGLKRPRVDIAVPPDSEEQLWWVSLEVVLEEGGYSNLFSFSSVNRNSKDKAKIVKEEEELSEMDIGDKKSNNKYDEKF